MMVNLVRVTDAETGELKRWENPDGKPLAIVEDGILKLTLLGRQRGYRVINKHLEKAKGLQDPREVK